MTLGEKIKYFRIKEEITQEQLAEKLIVSRSAIAKWESDGGVPELDNLKAIANMFHISIDELVDLNGDVTNARAETEVLFECTASEYIGRICDIELSGWNDGVNEVLILGEDKDFIFYQINSQSKKLFGAIGKIHIAKIAVIKSPEDFNPTVANINRNQLVKKRVLIEVALNKGLLRGFFDFTNDNYLDVVIRSFSDSKIILAFGKELEIGKITKIEEL